MLNFSVSLLIFCLFDLSMIERQVLARSIIMDMFISPFSSISFCFTYFAPLLFGACTFKIVMFSWLIDFFQHIISLSVSGNFIYSEVYFMWCKYSHLFFKLMLYNIYFFTLLLSSCLYNFICSEFCLDSMSQVFHLLCQILFFNWCI